MAWLVELDLGAGFVDYTSLFTSVRKKDQLHNDDLRSTTNTCKLTLAPDAAMVNELMVGDSDVPVRIHRSGADYFLGYIQRTPETEIAARLQPTELTAYDLGAKLNVRASAYTATNKAVSTIIAELLTAAGITAQSLATISTLMSVAVDDDEVTYFDIIDDILHEFGYVLYFNAAGTATTPDVFPASITPTQTLSTGESGNVRDRLMMKRRRRRYGGVKLTYRKTVTRTNFIVFSDATGAGQLNKCNIDLAAEGGTYPKRETASDPVYCEYAIDDEEIVAATSCTLAVNGSGYSVATFTPGARKAELKITGSGILTKLDIIAGTVVTRGPLTVKKSTIAGISEALEEIEAKYLGDDTQASRFVSGHLQYWKNAGQIYQAKTDLLAAAVVGTIVTLTDSAQVGFSQVCRVYAVETGDSIDDEGNALPTVFLESIAAYAAQTIAAAGRLRSGRDVAGNEAVAAAQAAALAQSSADKAAAAAGVSTAYSGGHLTPAKPTVLVSGSKRSVTLKINRDTGLLNSAGMDVQVAEAAFPGDVGYCPNIAASSDSSPWYTGAAGAYLTLSTYDLTLGWLPVALSDGLPVEAGKTYYFRVRERSTNASPDTVGAWSDPVSWTVKPTTYADIASKTLRTAQVDLVNYIKARNPNAALDGLEAYFAFDDVPAIPTNPQGTVYRSNFATVDGWVGNNSTVAAESGRLKVTPNAAANAVYTYKTLATYGKRVVIVLPYDADYTGIAQYNGSAYVVVASVAAGTMVRSGNYWIASIMSVATSGMTEIYLYVARTTSSTAPIYLNDVYVGDGSYTPSIPDGAEGTKYRNTEGWTGGIEGWTPNTGTALAIANGALQLTFDGTNENGASAFKALAYKTGDVVYAHIKSQRWINSVYTWDGTAGANPTCVKVISGYEGVWRLTMVRDTGSFGWYVNNGDLVANVVQIVTAYAGDDSYDTTYLDQSGKNIEARYYGVVPVEGVSGNAIHGDGATSRVDLPLIAPSSYTLALWFRTSDSKLQYLGGSGDTGAYGFLMLMSSASVYIQHGTGSVAIAARKNGNYCDGKWHLALARYGARFPGDPTKLRISIDGLEGDVVDASAPNYTGITATRIMQANSINSSRAFNGDIDEGRIYSRALTDDETAYLFTTPGGAIPGMVGGWRMVADSMTAREVAADTGIFAKIKTSNLDVDAYGSITRLNAGAIYCGATALSDTTGYDAAQLYTIPSPSPYAGKKARTYWDLELSERLRMGDANRFLLIDMGASPSKVHLNGSLKLGGAGNYFENSDGKIRITPDATANNFGEGLVFCTRDLASAIQAGDVRLSVNTYDTSPYKGSIREMRIATGATPAYSDTIYIREQMVFTGSGLEARHLLYTKCSGNQYTSGARFANPDGAIIADKAYQSTTRYTEWVLDANDSAPTARLNIYGAGDAYAVYSFTPFGTTSTSFVNWFQIGLGEAGLIWYSDAAAGGGIWGFGWYARDSGGSGYNGLGGDAGYVQVSGTYIQVKAASASYKMVATRVRMI